MKAYLKKTTPEYFKRIYHDLQQCIYKRKHSKKNVIGRNVIFSNDTFLGGECKIGNNVILKKGVRIFNGVAVRQNTELGRITVGEKTLIDRGVMSSGAGDGAIRIGKECYIGMYDVLDFSENLVIGDYVHIGGSTGIWTHSSAYMCINGIPLNELDYTKHRHKAPVRIENNVFIGGNCTIYPGVTIGHHSIIAPNSAVTVDVEPYSLSGGVPARLIKKISL